MSAVLEKIVDHRNTGDWRKNFWHVLKDNENPSWEYCYKFGTENQLVEAHSLVGIISYLVDDSYYDTDEIETKRAMLHNFSTKIFEYFSKIKQRATLTVDDKVLIELDGKSDFTIDVDISSDRLFLASLWSVGLLELHERSDVFGLSGGSEMDYKQSDCLKCRFYAEDSKGTFCKADMRNINHLSDHAKTCNDFLPPSRKTSKVYTYHELENFNFPDYVL